MVNQNIKTLIYFALLLCVIPLMVAWQSATTYSNTKNAFWGAVQSGYHRGQVEYSGWNRFVRAGDDYVSWSSANVASITQNFPNGQPAMVYHAFNANAANTCNGLRVGSPVTSFSWSNFPSPTYQPNSAGWGCSNNEGRVKIGAAPIANSNYWFQHLFKDTTYPSIVSAGELTVYSGYLLGLEFIASHSAISCESFVIRILLQPTHLMAVVSNVK